MNQPGETSRRSRIAGAILAGGRASRLGGLAKGAVPAGEGLTIAERLVGQFRRAGTEDIVIVANEPEAYRACGARIIGDLRGGIGPLGGIETALADLAGRADATAFVPCDMPRITWREIAALKEAFAGSDASVVFAQTGGFFWQPLCAVVHNDLRSRLSAAIDQGVRRVREFWQMADAQTVAFDEDTPFANINTHADLRAWIADRERAL